MKNHQYIKSKLKRINKRIIDKIKVTVIPRQIYGNKYTNIIK